MRNKQVTEGHCPRLRTLTHPSIPPAHLQDSICVTGKKSQPGDWDPAREASSPKQSTVTHLPSSGYVTGLSQPPRKRQTRQGQTLQPSSRPVMTTEVR